MMSILGGERKVGFVLHDRQNWTFTWTTPAKASTHSDHSNNPYDFLRADIHHKIAERQPDDSV